ncbi:MAG TPA: Gfo/Idh/MocA family oxidoreductase [Acetobacteraceae bacterium]|nr:Gfo/Idh/MocA family oxidoreductase [Acetobacteraceae bacterium]
MASAAAKERDAATRKLGVGVIGAGVISGVYMNNIKLFPGLALRGCADMRAEAAQAQAEKYGTRAMTVDELLASPEVDLVVNLTVPNAHFAVSHAALTAGKHVFSEKPLCVTVEEGRRLVAEAEARGLRLGCAPDTFLGAGGRLARHMIDEGRVGRILAGSAFLMSRGMEHWHPDPEFFFQPGGGPILDIGPYYLGALVNLLGPITRVQAQSSIGYEERIVTAPGPRTGHRIKVTTPTTVMALLQFAAGAHVVLSMSWDVHKHGHPALELYGTEGSLRIPDPNFFGGTVEYTEAAGEWQAADSTEMAFGRPNWRSPAWPPSRPDQANYRCLGMAELARAITHGTPHRSSGRLALHVLEAMYAILSAAESGATVELTPNIERPPALSEEEAARLAA